MEESTAHRVERVFPPVPVRQFLLTMPVPLRLLLSARPGLMGPALCVVPHLLARGARIQTGAVTAIQRFGSAAKLNVHFHCLALDGAYRIGADGPPRAASMVATTGPLPVPGRPGWRPRPHPDPVCAGPTCRAGSATSTDVAARIAAACAN
jgi:hypothetical protein